MESMDGNSYPRFDTYRCVVTHMCEPLGHAPQHSHNMVAHAEEAVYKHTTRENREDANNSPTIEAMLAFDDNTDSLNDNGW